MDFVITPMRVHFDISVHFKPIIIECNQSINLKNQWSTLYSSITKSYQLYSFTATLIICSAHFCLNDFHTNTCSETDLHQFAKYHELDSC